MDLTACTRSRNTVKLYQMEGELGISEEVVAT